MKIIKADEKAEYECFYLKDVQCLESFRKNLVDSGIERAKQTVYRWTNKGGVYVKVFRSK